MDQPSPSRGREACDSQSQKARGCCNISLRDGLFYQTVSRLLAANHIFLRSWMVDSRQEGCSLRLALQRRHTAHLRQCSCDTPGTPSGQEGEVIKMHDPPGTVHSPSTWSPELIRPGKGTKCTPNPQRLSQNCV